MNQKTNLSLPSSKALEVVVNNYEATLGWVTRDCKPRSSIVTVILRDNVLYIPTVNTRHKYYAIKRNPNISVCVSARGTGVVGWGCVSLYGTAEECEGDEHLKKMLCKKLTGNSISPFMMKQINVPGRTFFKMENFDIVSVDGKLYEENPG